MVQFAHMASPKKKKDPAFSLTLTLAGNKYQGSGADPLSALSTLKKPTKILGKGVLTVSNGVKSRELLMPPVKVKRLYYSSPSLLKVIAKTLFYGLQ